MGNQTPTSSLQEREDCAGGRAAAGEGRGTRRRDTIRLQLVLQADEPVPDDGEDEEACHSGNSRIDGRGLHVLPSSNIQSNDLQADGFPCLSRTEVGDEEGAGLLKTKKDLARRKGDEMARRQEEEEEKPFLSLVTFELPACTDSHDRKDRSSSANVFGGTSELRLWKSPVACSSTAGRLGPCGLGAGLLCRRKRCFSREICLPVYFAQYTGEVDALMCSLLASSVSSLSSSCSTLLSILTAGGEQQRDWTPSASSRNGSLSLSSCSLSSPLCSSLVSPYVPSPLPALSVLYSGKREKDPSALPSIFRRDNPVLSSGCLVPTSPFSSCCTAYILALRQFKHSCPVSPSLSPSRAPPHVLARLWRHQFVELTQPCRDGEGGYRRRGLQTWKNVEDILFSLPSRSWQVEWRRQRYASCLAVRALLECLARITRGEEQKKERVEREQEDEKTGNTRGTRRGESGKEQRERLFTVELLRAVREAEGVHSPDKRGREREDGRLNDFLLPVEDGGLDYDWLSHAVPPPLRSSLSASSQCPPSSSFREVLEFHLPLVLTPPLSSSGHSGASRPPASPFLSPVVAVLRSPRQSLVSDDMAMTALGLGSPPYSCLGVFKSEVGVLQLSSSPCLSPPAVPFLSLGRKQEISPGLGWKKPSRRSLVVCDLQIHTPPQAAALVCCPACEEGSNTRLSREGCCLLGGRARSMPGGAAQENAACGQRGVSEDSSLLTGDRGTSMRLLLFLHPPDEDACGEGGSSEDGGSGGLFSLKSQEGNGLSRHERMHPAGTEEVSDDAKKRPEEDVPSFCPQVSGRARDSAQLSAWLGKMLSQAAWSMRRNERATFFIPLPGLKGQASSSSCESKAKTGEREGALAREDGGVPVGLGSGSNSLPHHPLLDLLYQVEPPRIVPFVFSLHMLDFVAVPSLPLSFSSSTAISSVPSSISTTPSTSATSSVARPATSSSSSSASSSSCSLHIKRAASLLVAACRAQGELLRIAEDLQNFASIIAELLLHPRYSSLLISLLLHEMEKDDGGGEESARTETQERTGEGDSPGGRSRSEGVRHPLPRQDDDEELPFPGCETLEEQNLLLSLLQHCDSIMSSSPPICADSNSRAVAPGAVEGGKVEQKTKEEEPTSRDSISLTPRLSGLDSGTLRGERSDGAGLSHANSTPGKTAKPSGNSPGLSASSSGPAVPCISSPRPLFAHRSHPNQSSSSSVVLTAGGDSSTAATGVSSSSSSSKEEVALTPGFSPFVPPPSPKRSRWWSSAARRSSSRSRLLSLLSSAAGGGGASGDVAGPNARPSTLLGGGSSKLAIKNKKNSKSTAEVGSHEDASEGTLLGSFESPLRGPPTPASGKPLPLSALSSANPSAWRVTASTKKSIARFGRPMSLSFLSSGGGVMADDLPVHPSDNTRPEELDEGEDEESAKRGQVDEKKTKEDHHLSSRLGGRLSRLRSSALRSPLFRFRPSSVPNTPMMASGGGRAVDEAACGGRRSRGSREEIGKQQARHAHSSEGGEEEARPDDDEGEGEPLSPAYEDSFRRQKFEKKISPLSPHRFRRCSFSSFAPRRASIENVCRSCVATSRKTAHPQQDLLSEGQGDGRGGVIEIERRRTKGRRETKDAEEAAVTEDDRGHDEEVFSVDHLFVHPSGKKKSREKSSMQFGTPRTSDTPNAAGAPSTSAALLLPKDSPSAFFSSEMRREDLTGTVPCVADFAAVEKKLLCRAMLASWVGKTVLSGSRSRRSSTASSRSEGEDQESDVTLPVSASSCRGEDGRAEDYEMLLGVFLSGVVIQGVYFQVITSDEVWRQLHAERNAARVALWRDSQFPCPPLFLLLEVASMRLFVAPQQKQEYLPRVLLRSTGGQRLRQQHTCDEREDDGHANRVSRSAPLGLGKGAGGSKTAGRGILPSFSSLLGVGGSQDGRAGGEGGLWVDLEPPSAVSSPFSFLSALLSAWKQKVVPGTKEERALEEEEKGGEGGGGGRRREQEDAQKRGGCGPRSTATVLGQEQSEGTLEKWEGKTMQEFSSLRMFFFPPFLDMPFANARLYSPSLGSCSSSVSHLPTPAWPSSLASFLQAFLPPLKPTASLLFQRGERVPQSEERTESPDEDQRGRRRASSSSSSEQGSFSSQENPEARNDTRLGLLFPLSPSATFATVPVRSASAALGEAATSTVSSSSSSLSSVSYYPFVIQCSPGQQEGDRHTQEEEEEALLKRAVASRIDISDTACLELTGIDSCSRRGRQFLAGLPPRLSLVCKTVAGLLDGSGVRQGSPGTGEGQDEEKTAREKGDEEEREDVDDSKSRQRKRLEHQCVQQARGRHVFHVWLVSCNRVSTTCSGPEDGSSEVERNASERDFVKADERSPSSSPTPCVSRVKERELSLSFPCIKTQEQECFLLIVPVASPSFSVRMSAFDYDQAWDAVSPVACEAPSAASSETEGHPFRDSMKGRRSLSTVSFYSCPSMSQEAPSKHLGRNELISCPAASCSSPSSSSPSPPPPPVACSSPLSGLAREIRQVVRILTTEAAGHLGHPQALRSILHARHLPIGAAEWLMLDALLEEFYQDEHFVCLPEGTRASPILSSPLEEAGRGGERGSEIRREGGGGGRPRSMERTKEVLALLSVDVLAAAVKRFARSRAREAVDSFHWLPPDCVHAQNLSSCVLSSSPTDLVRCPTSFPFFTARPSPFRSFSSSVAAVSSWLLSGLPLHNLPPGGVQGRSGLREDGVFSEGKAGETLSSSVSPLDTSLALFFQQGGHEDHLFVAVSVIVCLSLAGLRACTAFPCISRNFPRLLQTVVRVATDPSSRCLLHRALGHHLGLSIPCTPLTSSSSRVSGRAFSQKAEGEEASRAGSRERRLTECRGGSVWECVSLSSSLSTSSAGRSMKGRGGGGGGAEREQERQGQEDKKDREDESKRKTLSRRENVHARGRGVRVWIRPRLKNIIDAEDVACVGLSTAQLTIDALLGKLPAHPELGEKGASTRSPSGAPRSDSQSSPYCSRPSSTASSFSSLPPIGPATSDDEAASFWGSSSRSKKKAAGTAPGSAPSTPRTGAGEEGAVSCDLFRWIKRNPSLACTGAEMLLPSVKTLTEHVRVYGGGEGEDCEDLAASEVLPSSAVVPQLSTSGRCTKERVGREGELQHTESDEEVVYTKAEQAGDQGDRGGDSVLKLPVLQAAFLVDIQRSLRDLAISQVILRCLAWDHRQAEAALCSREGSEGWRNKGVMEKDKKDEDPEAEQKKEFLTRLGASVGTLSGFADRHLLHFLFQLVLSFDPWKGLSAPPSASGAEEETPTARSRIPQGAPHTDRRRREGEEATSDFVAERKGTRRREKNEKLFVQIVSTVESVLVSVHCSLELQIAFLLLQGLNRLQRGFLSSARARLMKAIDLLEDLWGPLSCSVSPVPLPPPPPPRTKEMREGRRDERIGDNLVMSRALSGALDGSFFPGSRESLAMRCGTGSGVHPLTLLPAWLLLILSYCGAVTPSSSVCPHATTTLSSCTAPKPSAASRSPSGAAHDRKQGASDQRAGPPHHYAMATSAPWSGSSFELSTACISVYLEFIRLLRLKFPSFPLPVGPPHLVPRDLDFSPQITIDRRCKPPPLSSTSAARPRDDGAAPGRTAGGEEDAEKISFLGGSSPEKKACKTGSNHAGDCGKNVLLAESPFSSGVLQGKSLRAGQRGDLQEVQDSEALRLFGCPYSPKYPQADHCHLPEVSVLPPHRAAAIVLFNLCRVLPEVQQWISSFDIFPIRGDHAASVAQAYAGYTAATLSAQAGGDFPRVFACRKDSSLLSRPCGSEGPGENETATRSRGPMECLYADKARAGSLGLFSQPISCSPPLSPCVTLLPGVYIHLVAQPRDRSEWPPLNRHGKSPSCGGSSPGASASPVSGAEETSRSRHLREELLAFKREMHLFLVENERHLRRWYESQKSFTGLVYACGSNETGALGLGRPSFFPFDPVLEEKENASALANGIDLWWTPHPQRVCALPCDLASIASGVAHSMALTASGCLYTWGDNGAGQCGVGDASAAPPEGNGGDGWGNHREDEDAGLGVIASVHGEETAAEEERGVIEQWRGKRHSADVSRAEGLEEAASLSWVSFTHLSLACQEARKSANALGRLEGGKRERKEKKDGLSRRTQRRSKRLYEEKRKEEDGDRFPSEYISIPVEVCVYGKEEKMHREAVHPSDDSGDTEVLELAPPLFHKVSFSQIACGADYSAAVSFSGCLYTWGSNTCGVLGLGDTRPRLSPCLVDPRFFIPATDQVTSSRHPHGKTTDAGRGRQVSSGDGGSAEMSSMGSSNRRQRDVDLWSSPPVRVSTVSCGNSHMGVVVERGALFLWGSNWRWECGSPPDQQGGRKDLTGHPEDGQEEARGGGEILTPRELCVFDLAPLRQRYLSVYEAVMLWTFVQQDQKQKTTDKLLSSSTERTQRKQRHEKGGDQGVEGEARKRDDDANHTNHEGLQDASSSHTPYVAEPRSGVRLYVCPSKKSFTLAVLPGFLGDLFESVTRCTGDACAADKLLRCRLVFSLLSCGSVHTLALGHVSFLGPGSGRTNSAHEERKTEPKAKRDHCESEEGEKEQEEEPKRQQRKTGLLVKDARLVSLETTGGKQEKIHRGFLYSWGKDSGNCLGLGGKVIDACQECPARLRPELFTMGSSSSSARQRRQRGQGREEEEKALKTEREDQQQGAMLEVLQLAAGGTASAVIDKHRRLWLWGDVSGICEEFFRAPHRASCLAPTVFTVSSSYPCRSHGHRLRPPPSPGPAEVPSKAAELSFDRLFSSAPLSTAVKTRAEGTTSAKKDLDREEHHGERAALEVSSVVFPVEASRMLLITREGAVVALGDGCGIQTPHHAVAGATSNSFFERRYRLGSTEDGEDCGKGVQEGDRMTTGTERDANREEGGRVPSVQLGERESREKEHEEKEKGKRDEHQLGKGLTNQDEEIQEGFLLSATATVTPRFWVDKSRQERLHGIEHLVLPPGRRARMIAGGVRHLVLLTSASPCSSVSASLCPPLLLWPSLSPSKKQPGWTSHVLSGQEAGLPTPRPASAHSSVSTQQRPRAGGSETIVTAEREKDQSKTPWFRNLGTEILAGTFFSPSSSKDQSMFLLQRQGEEEKREPQKEKKERTPGSYKRSFSASSSACNTSDSRCREAAEDVKQLNSFFSFGAPNQQSDKTDSSFFSLAGGGDVGALKSLGSSSSFFSFTRDDECSSSSSSLHAKSDPSNSVRGSTLGSWASRFSMSSLFPSPVTGKKGDVPALSKQRARPAPMTLGAVEKEGREGERENEGMDKKRRMNSANDTTDRAEERGVPFTADSRGVSKGDTPLHAKFLKSIAEGLHARVQGAIEESLEKAVVGGDEEEDQGVKRTDDLKADKLEALLETVDRNSGRLINAVTNFLNLPFASPDSNPVALSPRHEQKTTRQPAPLTPPAYLSSSSSSSSRSLYGTPVARGQSSRDLGQGTYSVSSHRQGLSSDLATSSLNRLRRQNSMAKPLSLPYPRPAARVSADDDSRLPSATSDEQELRQYQRGWSTTNVFSSSDMGRTYTSADQERFRNRLKDFPQHPHNGGESRLSSSGLSNVSPSASSYSSLVWTSRQVPIPVEVPGRDRAATGPWGYHNSFYGENGSTEEQEKNQMEEQRRLQLQAAQKHLYYQALGSGRGGGVWQEQQPHQDGLSQPSREGAVSAEVSCPSEELLGSNQQNARSGGQSEWWWLGHPRSYGTSPTAEQSVYAAPPEGNSSYLSQASSMEGSPSFLSALEQRKVSAPGAVSLTGKSNAASSRGTTSLTPQLPQPQDRIERALSSRLHSFDARAVTAGAETGGRPFTEASTRHHPLTEFEARDKSACRRPPPPPPPPAFAFSRSSSDPGGGEIQWAAGAVGAVLKNQGYLFSPSSRDGGARQSSDGYVFLNTQGHNQHERDWGQVIHSLDEGPRHPSKLEDNSTRFCAGQSPGGYSSPLAGEDPATGRRGASESGRSSTPSLAACRGTQPTGASKSFFQGRALPYDPTPFSGLGHQTQTPVIPPSENTAFSGNGGVHPFPLYYNHQSWQPSPLLPSITTPTNDAANHPVSTPPTPHQARQAPDRAPPRQKTLDERGVSGIPSVSLSRQQSLVRAGGGGVYYPAHVLPHQQHRLECASNSYSTVSVTQYQAQAPSNGQRLRSVLIQEELPRMQSIPIISETQLPKVQLFQSVQPPPPLRSPDHALYRQHQLRMQSVAPPSFVSRTNDGPADPGLFVPPRGRAAPTPAKFLQEGVYHPGGGAAVQYISIPRTLSFDHCP